jgi:ABC-type uncharacterized transport system auxiliary subunit
VHRQDVDAGRRALVLLAPLSLAACVSVDIGAGTDAAHTRYVLQDPGDTGAPASATAPLIPALAVQRLAGDPMTDGAAIVYARNDRERATYALASWTDRTSHRVAALLRRRLERAGSFGAVVELGQPVRARWLLTISIDGVYHDVRTEPGTGVVQITATLIDQHARVRNAWREFRQAEPAAQANAAAATAAINAATGRVFDALVVWLQAELRRAAPGTA